MGIYKEGAWHTNIGEKYLFLLVRGGRVVQPRPHFRCVKGYKDWRQAGWFEKPVPADAVAWAEAEAWAEQHDYWGSDTKISFRSYEDAPGPDTEAVAKLLAVLQSIGGDLAEWHPELTADVPETAFPVSWETWKTILHDHMGEFYSTKASWYSSWYRFWSIPLDTGDALARIPEEYRAKLEVVGQKWHGGKVWDWTRTGFVAYVPSWAMPYIVAKQALHYARPVKFTRSRLTIRARDAFKVWKKKSDTDALVLRVFHEAAVWLPGQDKPVVARVPQLGYLSVEPIPRPKKEAVAYSESGGDE